MAAEACPSILCTALDVRSDGHSHAGRGVAQLKWRQTSQVSILGGLVEDIAAKVQIAQRLVVPRRDDKIISKAGAAALDLINATCAGVSATTNMSWSKSPSHHRRVRGGAHERRSTGDRGARFDFAIWTGLATFVVLFARRMSS
jgi:hypothetical protein